MVVHGGPILDDYLRYGVGQETLAGEADVAFHQVEAGVAFGHDEGPGMGDPGLLASGGDEHEVDRGVGLGVPGDVDQGTIPQEGGVESNETVAVRRCLAGHRSSSSAAFGRSR